MRQLRGAAVANLDEALSLLASAEIECTRIGGVDGVIDALRMQSVLQEEEGDYAGAMICSG